MGITTVGVGAFAFGGVGFGLGVVDFNFGGLAFGLGVIDFNFGGLAFVFGSVRFAFGVIDCAFGGIVGSDSVVGATAVRRVVAGNLPCLLILLLCLVILPKL